MTHSRNGSLSPTMCPKILFPGTYIDSDVQSTLGVYIIIILLCFLRCQPLSGKVTSVSQIEEDTSHPGGTEEEKEEEEDIAEAEGEEEAAKDVETQRVGREEEGERGKVEGRREYGGGRFAGVGDFEPGVQRVAKKRKVALPLFKCKPEASLRQV